MIVIFEPVCSGLEHTDACNRGVLAAPGEAFPEENLRFYSEAGHLDAVRHNPTGLPVSACRMQRGGEGPGIC